MLLRAARFEHFGENSESTDIVTHPAQSVANPWQRTTFSPASRRVLLRLFEFQVVVFTCFSGHVKASRPLVRDAGAERSNPFIPTNIYKDLYAQTASQRPRLLGHSRTGGRIRDMAETAKRRSQ